MYSYARGLKVWHSPRSHGWMLQAIAGAIIALATLGVLIYFS